jgi:hypothetical protein
MSAGGGGVVAIAGGLALVVPAMVATNDVEATVPVVDENDAKARVCVGAAGSVVRPVGGATDCAPEDPRDGAAVVLWDESARDWIGAVGSVNEPDPPDGEAVP